LSKDFTTSMSINGGPEVPIDLDKDINDPSNSAAKEQMSGMFASRSNVVAADQLRMFIERIERLNEEKQGLQDDIKDVFAEAKSNGYDTKTIRKLIAMRKMETHVRQEAEALLHTYAAAIGLPLFDGI
jgi:uncharacterized protein (UPF0335 family)